MSYAIGIDLGTTNSEISVYRRGVVETLLSEGRSAMPSVIPRQSKYPCRMGILGFTNRPMQDVVEFCV